MELLLFWCGGGGGGLIQGPQGDTCMLPAGSLEPRDLGLISVQKCLLSLLNLCS